jgi:hypothetical protein
VFGAYGYSVAMDVMNYALLAGSSARAAFMVADFSLLSTEIGNVIKS